MESGLQRTAAGAAIAAWPVVVMGAAIRVDGAAIGSRHLLLALPALVLSAITAFAAQRARRHVPVSVVALGMMAACAGSGALLALGLIPASFNSTYLITAMVAAGAAMLLSVRAPGRLLAASEGFGLLAAATTLAVSALLVTGVYVTRSGAAFACAGWPLCNGELLPAGERMAGINALHRFMAGTAAVLIGVLLWQALSRHRADRRVTALSVAVALAYLAEVAVGALWGWLVPGVPARAAHLVLATAVWSGLVALTALTWRPAPTTTDRRSPHVIMAGYVNLMKPRIIELLLVTTVPAMVLAARGMPPLWLILATLIGGTLTAGGANAINCYIDRDIDQVMKRTSRRALPTHRVAPARALTFGVAIGLAGFLELAILVNLLSAVLAVSAILFYVFVYTLWLKRSTVQNIVIGGAAGAIPPMVGWAAVTGRVDLPALVLFAIIFLWTPPHFWALALKYRSDYAAAGVPMLPVARGEAETRRQIFIYSLVLVASSLLLYVTGGAGVVYLGVALILGAALIRMAWQLLRKGDTYPVMKLFGYSITYLTVLFGAMVVDQAARSLV